MLHGYCVLFKTFFVFRPNQPANNKELPFLTQTKNTIQDMVFFLLSSFLFLLFQKLLVIVFHATQNNLFSNFVVASLFNFYHFTFQLFVYT